MTRSPGIPWTTSSSIEMQMLAGKPRYPLKDGLAPALRMWASARASSWAVVTPGLRDSSISASTSATMRPACRIRSISSRDFRVTIAPILALRGRCRPDCREKVVADPLDRPGAVNDLEGAQAPVMRHDLVQRAELLSQPGLNCRWLVVGTLVQFGAIHVASA